MKNQNLKDKVSVVMATYNGALFLEEQLDSILSQSILPNEIIVMDDCSSDRTRDILSSYKEKYHNVIDFKLIFRDKNVGYINNFIDGIKNARNELILLCDQDDIWLPNKVENIIKIFSDHYNCIAVHTNTHLIDKNAIVFKENAQEYRKELEKLNLSTFIKKVNYPGMALAFRKNKIVPKLDLILKQNITLPTHDWVICFLAVIQNGFYISNKVLTYRRYTGNNVALNLNSSFKINDRILGIKLYIKYYVFLKECFYIMKGNHDINIDEYIVNANRRIKYIKEKNIISLMLNVKRLKYYPTPRSYLGDVYLLLREK